MKSKAIALVVVAFSFLWTEAASSNDLERHKQAAQLIREMAADICPPVSREGSRRNTELSGDAKAKLGKVIGKMVDLGIEGAGKYNSDEYKNVLQKDLAPLIQGNTDCRLHVFHRMAGLFQIDSLATPRSPDTRGASSNPRKNVGDGTPQTRNESTDIRTQLSKSIKATGRNVGYTRGLDGNLSCFNGAECGIASFLLENHGDIPFHAAIRRGSTSIGSCIGAEMEAGGLKLYNNESGWSNNYSFEAVRTYIPQNSVKEITIKLENCSPPNRSSVDVSTILTVSAEGKVFDLTVKALAVPVN